MFLAVQALQPWYGAWESSWKGHQPRPWIIASAPEPLALFELGGVLDMLTFVRGMSRGWGCDLKNNKD